MNDFAKRFNALKRAKQVSPGYYSALIKGVEYLSTGNFRWEFVLTEGEFESTQVSQINVCSTGGGLNMLMRNLELLSIEGDWEAVESQLQAITDWPVEIEIVHSDQLDRAGKPYVNVYLTNDMKPKAVMAG